MSIGRGLWTGMALGAVVISPGAADAPNVVASIKPVHSLVAGVMQGVGEPALVIQGAGSPHTYSLRPSEARALEHADAVFWIGEGMETFLVKPLEALPTDARVVELAEAYGVTLLPTREGGMWEAHVHGEEHEQGDRHQHDEDEHAAHEANHNHDPGEHDGDEHGAHHDHGEAGHHEDEELAHHGDQAHLDGAADMHIWLDPHNAEAMIAAIAAALSEVDPEHAARYQQNAAAMRQEMEQLDAALRARLAPVRDRPFVVFHDAYQYFEQRYGLNPVGAISIGPDRRPGAQRLSEIRDRLQATEAACVFAEPQFEPAVVDTVIEGTGARKGVLDPLGATLEAGPALYAQLLESLAGSLAECLGAAQSG